MRRLAKGLIGAVAVSVIGSVWSATPASADVRVFDKIADLSTPIPNGTGNFSALSAVQVSLGNVVFGGTGDGNQRGIYRYDPTTGTRLLIVDSTTVLGTGVVGQAYVLSAQQSGQFAIYGPDVSFGVNNVAFDARMFTTRGGLHALSSGATFSGSFGPVPSFSMSDQIYVAHTLAPKQGGNGATVQSFGTLRDDGTNSLGPNFEDVLRDIARGNHVVYGSFGRIVGTRGAYFISSSAGTFSFSQGAAVSGPQAPNFKLPGSAEPYTIGGATFDDDGHAVVFVASSSNDAFTPLRTAVLTRAAGGALNIVADTGTVIPTFDGVTKFAKFGGVAIDGDVVAFTGGSSGNDNGIFVAAGGTLSELVSVGDTLDGRTITSLALGGERSLSGDDLVFSAKFSDGSTGLFLANVPEPGFAGVVIAAGGLIMSRRRRR